MQVHKKHFSLEGIVPKFQTILLEGAALVFLLITIPFWLPIVFVVGAIVLIITVILAIIGGIAFAAEIEMVNQTAVSINEYVTVIPFT